MLCWEVILLMLKACFRFCVSLGVMVLLFCECVMLPSDLKLIGEGEFRKFLRSKMMWAVLWCVFFMVKFCLSSMGVRF